MKVKVIEECVACGACESLCPDVFKVGDEIAVVVESAVAGNEECIRGAASGCPVNAIIVEE